MENKLNNTTQLENIYYIDVPESFKGSFGSFNINADIKLPIETTGIDSWNPEDLSWEMIISAMLKILAYNSNNENIEYYRNFIKAVRPNIIQELTDSAIIKSNQKDFNLAREIFLAIQGLEPNNDRNLLNLAVLNEQEAQDNESTYSESEIEVLLTNALRIYTELLNRESVLTDVYFNAGFFFIKTRKFEKAEICLKSFIEYSNDKVKIEKAENLLHDFKNLSDNEEIFDRAYRLIIEEKEHEAIKLLLECLNESEHIWNIWFLLGWAYRRISNFTEAISALEKSIKINDSISDTYNEISICFMETGQFDKCQSSLEKALSISPEDVKVISNMGVLQLKKGNMEEAKKFFETVLVFDPTDGIAKHYLENIL